MNLGALVENDVGQTGCRLLPRFLDVNDLLALATCCKTMLPYRRHLRHFTVQYKERMNAFRKRCLMNILREQINPLTLIVQDSRVIPLVLYWLPLTKLVALCFAPLTRPSAHTVAFIKRAIRQGCFKRLVKLGFYNFDMSGLVEHLRRDSCPWLRIISFDYCHFDDPVPLGTFVALFGLRRLAIRHCTTTSWSNYSLSSCVSVALKHQTTPSLVELQLVDLDAGDWDSMWLTEAIEAGAFRNLQELKLHALNLTDVGLTLVFSSVTPERCPYLEELTVLGCGMGKDATEALLCAIHEKRLPSLRRLCYG